MREELKTLKERVEHTLATKPATRNSDITLMIEVWKQFYGVKGSVQLEQLYDLPREDNIKRIRALFNAEGKYLPDDWEVARKRGINREVWENFLGYLKPGTKNQPKLFDHMYYD